jgi:hypothetical protein
MQDKEIPHVLLDLVQPIASRNAIGISLVLFPMQSVSYERKVGYNFFQELTIYFFVSRFIHNFSDALNDVPVHNWCTEFLNFVVTTRSWFSMGVKQTEGVWEEDAKENNCTEES